MPDSKNARRALFAAAAVLTCAVLLARLAAWSLVVSSPPEASELRGFERLVQMLPELPRIASGPGKRCVVLGSSAIRQGFYPDEFDARLAEEQIVLTSYNLGMSIPDPRSLRLLTGQIRALCERKRRKLFLSFIEFSPPDATEATLTAFSRMHVLYRAKLTGWRELGELLLESPRTGAELAEIKALGGRGAPELAGMLRRRLGVAPQHDLLRTELFREVRRIPGEGDLESYDRRRRGGLRLLFPSTREAYAAFVRAPLSGGHAASDREEEVEELDARELHFSDETIADFIGAVKNLQAVSEHTYVLLAPQNLLAVKPSSAGAERLKLAVSRIERETGAETIDFFSDRAFRPEDFTDAFHLNEISGRPKYMKALAARAAALIGAAGGRASR